MKTEFEQVRNLAEVLTNAGVGRPQVVIVLGSGMKPVEGILGHGLEIPYSELSGVPVPGVEGHSGKVLWGETGGVKVVMLCGRVHLYEGHSPAAVVRLLRACVKLGASSVVLTNAAGGINPDFSAGDIMAIRDHINLQGCNPFSGPVEKELGPRFPDQTGVYDQQSTDHLVAMGKVKEGVYLANPGPLYETPAEVRMARTLGADAVGMSTVQEAAAATAMGAKVVAFSVIANPAAGLGEKELLHDDVVEVVNHSAQRLAEVIKLLLPELS